MAEQGHIARETERYMRAAHRVQTAIAVPPEAPDMTQKHMRVGIDMPKSDMGGLVRLLIAKGVFTEEEYLTAISDAAEHEAASREDELSSRFGRNVSTL